VLCNDHFHGKRCPRGRQCAFFHKKKEKRSFPNWPEHGEYLPKQIVDAFLQPDVDYPPFAPAEPGSRQGKPTDDLEDGFEQREQEQWLGDENWSGAGNNAWWDSSFDHGMPHYGEYAWPEFRDGFPNPFQQDIGERKRNNRQRKEY
jgi:hypothetical protein